MADSGAPIAGAEPTVAITELRIEHARETLGIGVDRPRLSWTVSTSTPSWRQVAYELEIARADGRFPEPPNRAESAESVLVPWPFAPMRSREYVSVRVRVWGTDGVASTWSNWRSIEAGLLQPTDWSARFIAADWEEDPTEPRPSPLFRRVFQVRDGVGAVRLYLTALGVYDVQLNGQPLSDSVLDPGWTSYAHRLRYQTFDLTGRLIAGENVLAVTLGDGWYRGRLGWGGGRRDIYGNRLALLAQLELDYGDEASERVVTDESWRVSRGPILANDLYDGETYDARLEKPGLATAGFDDSAWEKVRIVERDLATLVAPLGPPMRRIEAIAPITITTSPTGRTVLDFGQNLVGWLQLKIPNGCNERITLRHAEVLQNGDLCTRPLRFARATDEYTGNGGESVHWEPRFTYHGFRYADIEGWPGQLTANDIRAIVVHSDLERTGWFDCSDPMINRLHENVIWSMHGNFLDIPTDCPQRDERLGWTGDIQVFSPTASFIYDCAGFLTSWLADLAAEQTPTGVVPVVIPNVIGEPFAGAAWGDAAVVVPWVLYERFGDLEILRRQFPSMRAWVDLVASLAGPTRLWDQGFQFGDWLDPAAPIDRPNLGRTDPHLVASAYFARSAEQVGQAAGVLGRIEDQTHYLGLAKEVRAAFAREYVTQSGRVASDSTTGYALALEFNLLPTPEQRARAGRRLAELVREGGFHVTTGFAGTPLICDALCGAGEEELAFRLLQERTCPSWLYPVTMGATTIWERWDSMLPDGTVNPGEMTSFNHYAFGAVADWLHRAVAGLAPAAPGYRRLDIRPRPGHGLTHARARHLTPYGPAESGWKIEGDRIDIEVVVPPNTTATVRLPGLDEPPIEVGSGTHRWSYAQHPVDGTTGRWAAGRSSGDL